MSKQSHRKLAKRQSSSVVSDTELDSILDDVEKIQENKVKVSGKAAGETLFTKEDERALKQIFDNVEKREQEFEELRVVASQSNDVHDDDCDSISSSSSKSSKNSEFEKMMDKIESDNDSKESDNESSSKGSNTDKSSEEDSTEDEMSQISEDSENENDRQKIKKGQNLIKDKQKTANNANDLTGASIKGEAAKRTKKGKQIKAKKVYKTNESNSNSNSKATASRKSDDELDSMVAELLEF